MLGCAQKPAFTPIVESSPLAGRLMPLYVENEYFGGNVNVTGLLTGTDVARALRITQCERCGVRALVTNISDRNFISWFVASYKKLWTLLQDIKVSQDL